MNISKETLGLKLVYKKQIVSDLIVELKETGTDTGPLEALIKEDNYGGYDCGIGKDCGAVALLKHTKEEILTETDERLKLINSLISFTRDVTDIKEKIKLSNSRA